MARRYKDDAHKNFFKRCVNRAKVDKTDTYRRAFFYTMGILPETRANITRLYDFMNNCPQAAALNEPWQTTGTLKMCRLALNLYNGFHQIGEDWETLEPDTNGDFTPYELFATSDAFYMLEAIKIRYPEYTKPQAVDFAELFQQGLAPAT